MQGQTARHDLPMGGQVALGRDPRRCAFAQVLEPDLTVGRLHAVIEFRTDGTTVIRDMHSVNGTFVNDEELPPGAERTLTGQDRFRLGQAVGRISTIPAPPGGQATGIDAQAAPDSGGSDQ